MNLKYCIMVILLIITTTGCKKSYQVDRKIENKLFQFTEIGSKELLTTKFPQQWRVHPYENSFPISESDAINFDLAP